jgi:hypothetical protein
MKISKLLIRTLVLVLLPTFICYSQELPLYNGSEYSSYYYGFKGHPNFLTDSLQAGDVVYEGILYKNVPLGYNLVEQEVFTRHPRLGYNIRLVREKISSFTIDGRTFLHLPATASSADGFYQLLFDGHIKALALFEKKETSSIYEEIGMHFVQYEQYFIYSDKKIHTVENLNDVTRLFSDRKEDIKKLIRNKRLSFRKDPFSALTVIAKFYEGSKGWTGTTALELQKKTVARAAENNNAFDQNKIIEIGSGDKPSPKNSVTLAGYVKDAKTGESIIGATVSAVNNVNVFTDQFGYYALTLEKGRHEVRFTSSGMKDERRNIILNQDGKLDVELTGSVASLKAVIVVADRNLKVRSPEMSVEKLTMRSIRRVPVIFGEADVLRVITTLPGVSTAGEASTGFNVRGGSADQNLILFNEATIYNPSHVFGFFSAFNPDIIKAVELYKSSIPERFGGRLSSVLDVSAREGNSKNISGSGGIGPLTGKLTLEGPLGSKTTFVTGVRTTYSNWIMRQLPKEYRDSRASFYDVTLNATHTFNPKNTIFVTGYISNDKFRFDNDTSYQYGNTNFNLKWKHVFNNKLYSVITAGHDYYNYNVSSEFNPVNAFKLGFKIDQSHFRTTFSYALTNKHLLDFGVNSIYYTLKPGSYKPNSPESLVTPDELQQEQALESAFYIGDRYTVSDNLAIQAGLRVSVFNYLGPYTVYQYQQGTPKDTSTITGSEKIPKGKVIKTYGGPEYRLSARYTLTDQSSVKVSFNTMRQYIHMLSNTTIISPTDIWKLSDADIRPQQSTQYSAGYYMNFDGNEIETSVEVYYKTMKNVLDFKSGARLIMNKHIAADVINARGKSYGAEFMIKKNSGKFNGWLSYTFSRTLLQQDDDLAGEYINRGEYYPASFDKPHILNFIGNYRFTHRFSLSANVVYNTGRPITMPIAIFELGGAERVYYSDRNQYRIPDYFRADLSFTLDGNHKLKQRIHNSWSFGVYNLTARKNPYSVYFTRENDQIKGYQLSIFGTMIPFVTFNFRF